MFTALYQFAAETAPHAEEASGGLSALGLNVQAFLFQLITFVIVLLILRKFVFKKLVTTLEERRKAVEDSIENATKAETELKNVETKISALLKEAREEAETLVAAGQKEANQVIEAAEGKAKQKAEHIVKEAKAQMDVEVAKAQEALKAETARLVALATEQIIREKLDPTKDAALIKDAIQRAKES